MKKVIIANWKMQLSYAAALRLAGKLVRAKRASKREVVICPDYLALPAIARILRSSRWRLGAQDSAPAGRAALTGEVSPADLRALGVRYVIIGHSERREHLHENAALINDKVKVALAHHLIPVLCVGEKSAERKSGEARQYLSGELSRVLAGVKIKKASDLVVAYEPLWAISTGRGAKPMRAIEADVIQGFLKARAKRFLKKSPRVIYGGSVNAANAADFLQQKNIDGLLVGGASLDSREFMAICSQ